MTIDVFTPLHLNPVLFCDPKDSANVTMFSGTSNKVEVISDLSPSGNNFDDADTPSTWRATYDAATGLISMPLLAAFETLQALQLADLTILSTFSARLNHEHFFWQHGSGSNHRGLSRGTDSNSFPVIVAEKDGSTFTSSLPSPTSGLQVHVSTFSADTARLHIGGDLLIDEADSRVENDITGTIVLGPNASGGGSNFVDQAEFVVFDRALNAWQRQSLEGWAAHHRTITSSLIDNHPYKSQPPMRVVGPNATISGGGAIDIVRIFNWPDGALHLAIAPEANGDWWVTVPAGMEFGITYIAAGCAPITHGPYNAPIP